MVWTQTKRHVQLSSAHPDIATSLIQQADLVESLLGMPLPDSVWSKPALMPTPDAYPSPYHQDQRAQSYQQRQLAIYCGYRISITLLHPQAGLDTKDWIWQNLAIHWHTGDMALPHQTRHGMITEVVALGSNSGMAAYRIVCEPALNQLRLSSHNRRHHHLSLGELITNIVSPYEMDIEIDERLSDYHIQHSVQYNQTDLAYLTQYLALYGVTGYYRHDIDKHTLVLLPHNAEVLRPDTIEVHSILSQNPANLADRQDRITAIRPRIAQHTQQSNLHRYDNRLMSTYTGSSSSEQPIDSSNSTHQRFLHSHSRFDDESLHKLATRYQKNAQQLANLGCLTGNIRHLNLPSAHHIDGNPYLTDPISIVSIHQNINNHIPADWLGSAPFDPITLQPHLIHNNNDNNSEDDSYDNVHHINACYLPFPHHHHIPYGEQLATLGQPHPSLTGLMSASIIDTESSAITHDRNHRAHIRYHWQQDEGGQDDNSDTSHWVPIASHLVADHMGQTHPLRHGQQVLIDFIGGDITHPIIIGSTHNGQGNSDAQHNSISSDTDFIDATSPAWFINQSHAHPIDGIKTQSIDSSRTGEATKDSLINGYNQLMFDAHPDSPQINVYSSSYQSSLTIGHLYQHTDHTRGQARGQGISIETQAAANIQGSTGIHISSRQSDPSSSPHMSHDSHSKLQTADQHQQAYAQLAETHQPVGLEGSSNNKQSNSKEDAQTPFAQFSKATNDETLSESGQWQQAHLLIDSQRHLAMFSGQHSQHTSTQSTHSHATDNTHHHSQTQMNQLVAGDIHYYANKAQTHTAAHGDVTIQAHQNEMRLDSEQVLRIHSRDSIEVIAPDTLTLKAAGSGIEISGGNVTFITPKQVGYKASKVDWGSGGESSPTIRMPQDELADCAAKTGSAGNKGGAV
ncbi:MULTISPECIES: contractile injection system protein, VgrG/Pvc8 family [Psychrobacter]|uniref:contractile injection system protein, VgrG/Pvc8 family n=1 Tax=Psychrobacter TaxID=497 RepID=UPI000EBA1846|nr:MULTISPECIES: contractile injection system protein, VgrG/Pvc8 family [Psychrobacter]HCT74008.1 hypothetical protein [Psychrobacter sp.]